MKQLQQRYHVVFKKGTVTVRRPWKGKDVELFSSGGVPDKDIPAMFGNHEERQFLEKLGPFIVVSIDTGSQSGSEQATQILDEGYEVTDPDTKEKSQWYVAGYYVRDDGAVYIMTPNKTSDDQFFQKLGLRVDLEGKWGNSFKVGKYMKRLYSHHRKYVQGEVISKGDGETILVRLSNNSKVISVRYADYGKLTDGMNLVSTHFMKMLGLKRDVGQGLRITALSPKGFSKGHAIVLPELRHDLVLFNSKKLLYGEQFTFGVDWLHSGALFTDVQSVVNFRMYRTSFLEQWAEVFMNQVIDAIQDEEKLRRMLNFYNIDFHKHTRGEEEGEYIEKEKDWALLRALRGGVGHKPHPALVRKIFHLFADKIMDCESNIRIPVPTDAGGARYAMVDPTIFDINGDPTLEGSLRGNTVYLPNVLGDVAFHRQPNAHRDEHHIATAVPQKELSNLDAGHFMFLSKDMVVESLDKLGGGDQDDRLVYYNQPDVVNHFKQLELDPYPVVKYPEPITTESRVNRFAHRILRMPMYDKTQLLIMLEQQKKQSVSIGYAVNAIIHDTILTDEKSNILDFMFTNLPNDRKNNSAIQWLEKRPDNQLKEVTSRLELVIDSVKKEGSDLKDIGDAIRTFNATFEVVAQFCTTGGRYDGRVPTSRRNETHPVIVRCKVDETLETIHNMRRDLEDIITDISWQMLQPIPLEILTQPVMPGSVHLAAAIQSYYRQQWANLGKEEIPLTGKEQTKKRIQSYIKIDESVYRQFKDNPMIIDAMVHLYTRIYSNRLPQAPRDNEGKPKPFADGILWGPRMSGLTMKALELCGLAGRYEQADIDPEFKHTKRNTTVVEVYKHIVLEQKSGIVLGSVESAVNATNVPMEKGFIKVPAPRKEQEELMSLAVVNGMEQRGATASEIAEWRSHAHEKVNLVPYLYDNNGVEEHAVRVMLAGRQYGHITRKDAIYITQTTEAWLMPGNSPKTMAVVVKK